MGLNFKIKAMQTCILHKLQLSINDEDRLLIYIYLSRLALSEVWRVNINILIYISWVTVIDLSFKNSWLKNNAYIFFLY